VPVRRLPSADRLFSPSTRAERKTATRISRIDLPDATSITSFGLLNGWIDAGGAAMMAFQ
jgi:hypothetical protein